MNTKHELTSLFVACCSAPGWQIWGSDTDTSPGPNPTLTGKERNKLRDARFVRSVPGSLPTDAIRNISPAVIVDAIVHCVDRAARRQPIHDPETDHKLSEDLERFTKFAEEKSLTTAGLVTWEFTVKEIKRRENFRKALRIVDGEEKMTKIEDCIADREVEVEIAVEEP